MSILGEREYHALHLRCHAFNYSPNNYTFTKKYSPFLPIIAKIKLNRANSLFSTESDIEELSVKV